MNIRMKLSYVYYQCSITQKNIRNYTTNYTKLNVNVARYKKVERNI